MRKWKKRKGIHVVRDEKHVAILTPCGDMVHTDYAMSLASMVQHTVANPPPGVGRLQISSFRTSLIQHSRNHLARAALSHGATHMLWIDSDQKFPNDMISQFCRTSLPIVGCNIMQRHPPFGLTAWKGDGPVATNEESAGLEKVDRVGFGVLWVESEVFRRLPEPWFATPPCGETTTGEDVWFCRLAQQHGIEIHIDHDLSKRVGHVGQFVFMPQHAARCAGGE